MLYPQKINYKDKIRMVEHILVQIINKLCEAHRVPNIPVVVQPLDNFEGYFDEDGWTIYLDPQIEIKNVYHEFSHYCVALMRLAEDLEEDFCNYSMEGLHKNINKNYPIVKELVKRLEEKNINGETDDEPEKKQARKGDRTGRTE